ncbi:pyruvate, phosphate dikinase [Variovorax sp. Sphag1AA]|uniref:pyruvate, phosphate dikinase n=1 Tax=Variovorax sp. Sphag1AA TaxID=2587027 RepID=UPI001607622D|nr:pyruvate, phosphate dikinase [Variovorax sp. Sphag1AA]MBB3180966.1 pyruvate,orthophosphate dikinase [Variovorax sp. Sphag1AA]
MNAMTDILFVRPVADIDPDDTARYGGKATGLARMAAAGIPVPPAFVIGTDGYQAFRDEGGLPEALRAQAMDAIGLLERATGRRFGMGAEASPLLVSVRSGAQISMPGMMDTVLNLGITARGAQRLGHDSGNPAFALDTWLRFWRMFCDIVLDLDGDAIAETLAPELQAVREQGDDAAWQGLERAVLEAVRAEGVEDVQADPHWQLQRAIGAVFESWDSRRARAYRAHHKIDDALGTAVTVQAMVFGNFDARSGSGVAFTRNPNTGARELYGEFLLGRQGEDLVSGSATPVSITEPGAMREAHREELQAHGQRLEKLYRDAVDIEFTVEGDQLYFLQVRPAKRTAQAAVVTAVELVDDRIISPSEALRKVSVEQLKKLLRPSFESAALQAAPILVEGIGASPGHAWGVAVLDADRASERAATGERVVLLRPTTSPQDIRGMLASDAIVTARGGALSHAAVVSRALDVPCVVGCEGIEIDPAAGRFTIGGQVFEEGMALSVDGATGRIYAGHLPIEGGADAGEHIDRLLDWADDVSEANFWTADVGPADVDAALRHATAGLGVVALTDLMIGVGDLARFIEAINDLSRSPEDTTVHRRITELTKAACAPLLAKAAQSPVALRLPNLGSPRAQRMIDTWASLAPRLFLPLGLKGFYMSMLRGIAQALQESGHPRLTVLAPALGDVQELEAFCRAARSADLSSVGVMLQSPSGLFSGEAMTQTGAALWLDIREIIRTFHGYPSALSFGDEVFEDYLADGYLGYNPRTRLGPELRGVLQRLAQSPNAAQVGVECGDGTALSLIEDLYALGLRIFSLPVGAIAGARLGLGQFAAKQAAMKENV